MPPRWQGSNITECGVWPRQGLHVANVFGEAQAGDRLVAIQSAVSGDSSLRDISGSALGFTCLCSLNIPRLVVERNNPALDFVD